MSGDRKEGPKSRPQGYPSQPHRTPFGRPEVVKSFRSEAQPPRREGHPAVQPPASATKPLIAGISRREGKPHH